MSCSVKINDVIWSVGDYGTHEKTLYVIESINMDESIETRIVGVSLEHSNVGWWTHFKTIGGYRGNLHLEFIEADGDIKVPKEIVALGPDALRLHLALLNPDVSPDWGFLDELFVN